MRGPSACSGSSRGCAVSAIWMRIRWRSRPVFHPMLCCGRWWRPGPVCAYLARGMASSSEFARFWASRSACAARPLWPDVWWSGMGDRLNPREPASLTYFRAPRTWLAPIWHRLVCRKSAPRRYPRFPQRWLADSWCWTVRSSPDPRGQRKLASGCDRSRASAHGPPDMWRCVL